MGSTSPYKLSRKSLTSTLTKDEHKRFSTIAAQRGMLPTTYATQELRKLIARENEKEKVA